MTTHEDDPSILSDEELERRLFSKERVVAFFVALLFALLLAFPGRDALLAWDHSTVAVIADAATSAAAIGIPAAVIYGGRDLVLWIARIVMRAIVPTERLVTRPDASGYRASARFKIPAAKKMRSVGGGVAAIAVIVFLGWLSFIGFDTIQRMLARTDAIAEAGENLANEQEAAPDRAMPSFCNTNADEIICTANSDANSAEELGRSACGMRGLGREIFDANRERNGFTFDEYHVPLGTSFGFSCPATN